MKNRRLKFGLAILFAAVVFAATFFTGYRIGSDRGYSAGQSPWRHEKVSTVSYEVGDLLEPGQDGQPDFDLLINSLTSAVEPESWDDVGGVGTAKANPPSEIIVNHTPSVQKTIASVLQSIRDGRRQKKTADQK